MSTITSRVFLRVGLLAFALLLLAPARVLLAAETGDLPALRQHALELVNATRREHGREPLTFSDTLNQIAQAHAEDMLARDYYAHASPEGEDARDRYVAAGGGRYELVAENIASCSPCAEGPQTTHVEQMHRQWMDSRHHRQNILSAGVAQFGFGIVAGDEGPLYAVQTFAGPGTPRGDMPAAAGDRPPAPAMPPDQVGPAFAQALNARREARSRPPLELSNALSETAQGLLPEQAGGEVTFGRDALAGGPQAWATTSALVGSCGGCGAVAVEADVDTFLDMWLQNPAYEQRLLGQGPTSVGFALRAYGDGRKVAVAVLGERR